MLADLNRAIQVTQEAIDTTQQDHLSRALRLGNFGIRLGDRYLRTGAPVDLDKVIQVTEDAVAIIAQDRWSGPNLSCKDLKLASALTLDLALDPDLFRISLHLEQ